MIREDGGWREYPVAGYEKPEELQRVNTLSVPSESEGTRVRIDVENHLASRRSMPSLRDEIIPRLNTVKSKKIIGVVDWGDKRYQSLVDPNHDLIEWKDEEGRWAYVPIADTLLVHGCEMPVQYKDRSGEKGEFHAIAFGIPAGMEFPEDISIIDFHARVAAVGGIKILGEIGDSGSLARYFLSNRDDWKEFDAMKIWAGSTNPLDKEQNERAKDLYLEMASMVHVIGSVATSDGHSVPELFTSYNETRLDWDDLLSSRDKVVTKLGKVLRDIRYDDFMVCKKSSRGSLRHAAMVGWDHHIKKWVPGFSVGDPFAPGYVPGWLESQVQRVIGPFRV